ncbi:unnamed protein product, partial [Rotaria sordida]
IARKVGCCPATVKLIIDLFEETNYILERQDRGRYAIIFESVRRQFRQIFSRFPTSTSSSIANRLWSRTGSIVSARTIRRVRRQENYHPVYSKNHWTIHEAQAMRRLHYATTHETDLWQNVIFTNEKKFQIDESGTVFWVLIGTRRPKT